MKYLPALLITTAIAAQQPDPFDSLWGTYQAKERQWKQADDELRAKLPALDPCASETRQRIETVRRLSAVALDASIDYYQSWRARNETILRMQKSSEQTSAADQEKIVAERDHTRMELASLKKRAAELGERTADGQMHLESLRQLIESVEASLRRWEDILRELETEKPERRNRILREQSVVASIEETIRWVKEQREYYDLVYRGRIDASGRRCLSGGRR